MPNHITNWVEISGTEEQIAKLKKAAYKTGKGQDIEPEFDFNGIIPMPAELKDTSASTEVVKTQAEADEINAQYVESMRGHNQSSKIRAITVAEAERRTALYGDGDLRAYFKKKYGILNWYDWALKFWGTKWGAYDVEKIYISPTKLVLRFRTAWSTPDAIFQKLEDDGYKVNAYWHDEDPSNDGIWGNPYDVFAINHDVIVDYYGGDIGSKT